MIKNHYDFEQRRTTHLQHTIGQISYGAHSNKFAKTSIEN